MYCPFCWLRLEHKVFFRYQEDHTVRHPLEVQYRGLRIARAIVRAVPSIKGYLTSSNGNSTTSRNFSICSLHPPTSAYVIDGRSSTYLSALKTREFDWTDLHHRDGRIDLRRKGNHDFIVCSVYERHSRLTNGILTDQHCITQSKEEEWSAGFPPMIVMDLPNSHTLLYIRRRYSIS